MVVLKDLYPILDRIADHQQTAADISFIRQHLASTDGEDILQLGKYNINIGEGQDIRIGNTIYEGANAETIRELLKDILQEYHLLPHKPELPTQVWRYLHTFRGHAGAVNALVLQGLSKLTI